LGLNDNHFVFAFIARKSLDKRVIDLLKAFARVSSTYPAARLLFVGPDESDGELRRLQIEQPDLFNKVLTLIASITTKSIWR
jgi:glycosyltransferase involved in cell wall biosynthesis